MKIELNHITRIEGHAHLVVDRKQGEIKDCRLEIVESPRFFEAMLKGRHFSDVAPIVARVCGVCSISHTLASLMATEQALGVEPDAKARLLRRLLSFGEIMQSHLLQLYFMAVPDYLGISSIFQLLDSRRELVARALRLKRTANRICEVIGGRPIHPVTTTIGGFSVMPYVSDLKHLRQELVAALPDLEATVELFAGFDFPEFERETEYICLSDPGHYPLHANRFCSSSGLNAAVTDYKKEVEEYLTGYSTAKFARTARGSYMVGPLARFKNNFPRLSPMARKVASALTIDADTINPYHSLKARLVEVVNYVEESIHTIDELLLHGLNGTKPRAVPTGGGQGTAAVEAPRGLLFHSYTYDRNGLLDTADCVIPTAQNLANIETDLKAILPELLDRSDQELTRRLEMLIRSYDPCLSCSTHLLKIDLV
ncbi:MAG TPA: Ni/Fe hydrogenase subunit alpha [Geopsychrobacteraceae bacterium]|nr:Ni/Fe hydrogenase subunit alpha [Geopsychrobacteraceae bacterium]